MNYKVYTADSEHQAYIIKETLDNHGIKSFIKNLSVSHLRPSMLAAFFSPEIWIYEKSDVEKASKVIYEEIKSLRLSKEQVLSDKTCQKCNEISPGNFSECWNCKEPLD